MIWYSIYNKESLLFRMWGKYGQQYLTLLWSSCNQLLKNYKSDSKPGEGKRVTKVYNFLT